MVNEINKKVIIIGATSGIGKALAIQYANAGCTIGITGRRNELLNQIKATFPKQIETACFDVMGNDNILHLETLIHKMSGMDLLIYNAGYGDISKQLQWQIDKTTVCTNVNGFVEIVNYAFNYFEKQKKGQIAATSSIASIGGNSYAPAYSASKAFMSVYLEGLHIKAKRQTKNNINIYVTDIQPGFVKTAMAKGSGKFWEASPEKTAHQMFIAINKKRFRVYVTKRWWVVATLLKILPGWLYRKIF